MSFDILFSEWIYQFYFLKDIAEVFSGRIFSGTLVACIGLYFFKIKKFKIFLFICLATGLGDLTGNILKDLFLQPRPCFNSYENFPMIERCGSDLTGMPSNHTLNFFLFSTLVHLFLKKPFISIIFFTSSVLVALSRVLLIKHLLSQVIIGGLIGIVMAKIFFEAYVRWKQS